MAVADVFRVPMEVTYAIQGGEPALMAYRRWRNISRDDLAAKSGVRRACPPRLSSGPHPTRCPARVAPRRED
jgi:hypothetical protein